MNKARNTKGITLVALVITIIIMLILAGITISLVIGENGIIKRAQEAGKNYQNAAKDEEKMINEVVKETDNILAGNFGASGAIISDKSGASTPTGILTGKEYVKYKWNESKKEYEPVLTSTQPDNWYNYENGEWANIKTTNNSLEAYWVWIPRYEYIVPTSTTATEIEVKFIPTTQTTADAGYTIHPAFTNAGNGGFGDLDGIWVGKFESSSNNPSASYGGDSTTDLKVQVRPGVQSWRHIEVSKIFTVCRRMTNTGEVLAGSAVDSHMMKNTEWGAVAILSQSKYGIYNPTSSTGETQGVGDNTKKVWNNPYGYGSGATIKTGYVGNSANAATDYSSSTAPSNVIEYNKKNTSGLDGTKASSTGTVYGVYDMAGGSWEYIAGVLKGNSNELENAESKFNISNQTRPSEETEANFAKKYLDLYDYRTSGTDYTQYITGDATVETKAWNEDFADMVTSSDRVCRRGR